MDKAIEVVVVAMVAMLVAITLIFLVQDRSESFGGFLDNQKQGAQCELWKSQGKCDMADQCSSWSEVECRTGLETPDNPSEASPEGQDCSGLGCAG